LEHGRKAALALFEKLRADARFVTAFARNWTLLYFCRDRERQQVFALSRKIFEAAAKRDLHLP